MQNILQISISYIQNNKKKNLISFKCYKHLFCTTYVIHSIRYFDEIKEKLPFFAQSSFQNLIKQQL